ncbi:MAG: acyltransferase [Verrucomicrobiota bacterium]
MNPMISPDRQNNFDLIRLLAAAQVVVAHAIGHTDLVNHLPAWGKSLFDALMLLPGVPVFFVISGFLITKSYERNPSDLAGYFWRRGLRIFPALWVCLFFTLAALAAFGFLTTDFLLTKTFIAWLAGQVSFFQFYNPEHFRGFGIGVANGALWTITVELQFYIFVPILYFLTGGAEQRATLSKAILGILFFVSFALYCVMDDQVNGPGGFTGAPLPFKLLHVTVIPHLWMFLLGILIHRNFERLKTWIEGTFLWYLVGYILFMGLLDTFVAERSLPFYLAYLPSRTLLAFATIAGAFSARTLSQRLLGGTDVSYGIYIYHSLVINIMVQLGMMTSMISVVGVYIVSIILALMSWHLVEKPVLGVKSLSPRSIWSRLTGCADSGA